MRSPVRLGYPLGVSEPGARTRFSVDVKGLLEALTEQFPEPLLCVRELIQNAADAGAQRIEVEVSFDDMRGLFRLSVRDDGRGMDPGEVEAYLTIGHSEKDPTKDRGRFGVGKLSPYALGITRMSVETSTAKTATRLTFYPDGSGHVASLDPRPRGTVVRVYKQAERQEAESLAERTAELVEKSCGSIRIPLFVNGVQVNHEIHLPTPYALQFTHPEGEGVIGLAAEPQRTLMSGRIVLETDAPILGPDISYVLDSARLSPTLSRNAVRRDAAFEALLRVAQAELPRLCEHVSSELRVKVERIRQRNQPVERDLDAHDRAALEWLRTQLLEPDTEPADSVRDAPVLETADGGLVSAGELIETLRRERRVPASRVPRTRDELAAYADRGVPVLLLYRDIEDFLERQGIDTVEVDGSDDGLEIAPGQWGPGELALAVRPSFAAISARRRMTRQVVLAGAAAMLVAGGLLFASAGLAPLDPDEAPALAERAGPLAGVAGEEVPPAELAEPSPPPEVSPPASGADPSVASVSVPSASRATSLRSLVVLLAGILALLSAAAGLALLLITFGRRKTRGVAWLRAEAGAPLRVSQARSRRLDVLGRALFHPIDFFVARGWSMRSSGARAHGAAGIKGYRELAPEPRIRTGVRLDLDRVQIGFVELLSAVGEPHDGRILLRRDDRVLLNRNHPTVADLIRLASVDSARARVMLDALLATDPELARETDPRQVEWDLLARSELALRQE